MQTSSDCTPLLRPYSDRRPNNFTSSVRVVCTSAALALLAFIYVASSVGRHAYQSLPKSSSGDSHITETVETLGSSVRNHSEAVVFAVIGDWGRLGKFNQRETGQAMAKVLPPNTQCIISAGDNFYDYGVTSVSDEQFQTSFEDVYTDPTLKRLPWYVVLGNHDYRGSVHAQIQYSRISTRWKMPSRYFSLWLSPNLMGVFIDTTPLSNSTEGRKARQNPEVSTERQLTWLKNTLRSAPPRCRFFVVGHHNMYSSSVLDHRGDSGVREAVEPVLAPYASRVVAYVAGHEHALMHMQPYAGLVPETNGYDHFVTGAGSRLRPIKAPNSTRADHWRECCGVLAPSANASRPRTVWSGSINSFFLFEIRGDMFSSTGYDKDARVVYRHERILPAV